MTLIFIILAVNMGIYLRIADMKGQFKNGKDDNVLYLTIFGNEMF